MEYGEKDIGRDRAAAVAIEHMALQSSSHREKERREERFEGEREGK